MGVSHAESGPLAFIMGHKISGRERLDAFLTNIDKIEHATGLDFLSRLPDDVEDKVESLVARKQNGEAH